MNGYSDQLNDEEIAKQTQQGDSEIFGVLVERYEQKMTRYARRFLFNSEEAQDMVQEVFIKAYENIQSFDASRRFSPWLYRIAHNEFINAIKKKKGEPVPFFDPDTLFPHPISPDSADKEFSEKELKEVLDGGLSKISSKYREPLILYFFENLSYQEIAEVMHIPVSTVGVRISRGKSALKTIIHPLEGIYEPRNSPAVNSR